MSDRPDLPLHSGDDGGWSGPPSPPEAGSQEPHAFALSRCQDELDVMVRVVRRHFWRRLLPGLGITTYMVVYALVGVPSAAWMLAAGFGGFTAFEALKFRGNLKKLRALENELEELERG